MGTVLNAIKIKNANGSYSEEILIGALAKNIKYNEDNVENVLDTLNYRLDNFILPDGSVTANKLTSDLQSILVGVPSMVGTPLTANSSSAMTDHDKVYVFTGTTTSTLTNGHWYYWNGSAWTDGGAYNSQALETDKTLTVSGSAADAKIAGDRINTLKRSFQKTQNLWLHGDVVVPSSSGYTTIILDEPITPGQYTISATVTIQDAPAENSRIYFYKSKTSFGSSTVEANFVLANNSGRRSNLITTSNPVYAVRFLSAGSLSASSGYGGIYSNIQIERGSTLTDYTLPYLAADYTIRDLVDGSAMLGKTLVSSTSVYNSCDDFPNNAIFGVSRDVQLSNRPFTYPFTIMTFGWGGRNAAKSQIAVPWDPIKAMIAVRTKVGDVWKNWHYANRDDRGEDGVLQPTGDDTDRSDDILNQLLTYGICRLTKGSYYVSSSFNMPNGSSLVGTGESTKIYSNTTSSIPIIIMGNKCTVKDISLYGNENSIELDGSVEGTSEFLDVQYTNTNLWAEGNKNVSSTGYLHFVLSNPIPAGRYRITATVTSTDSDATQSTLSFSTAQSTSIGSGNIIANINFSRGSADTKYFTISQPVYSVRLTSSTSISKSSGDTSSWTNIVVNPAQEEYSTVNLWEDGNRIVTSTGYSQFLLTTPLQPGRYKMSAIIYSTDTNSDKSTINFSTSQTSSIGSSTIIASVNFDRNTSDTQYFTISRPVYSVRLTSGTNLANSSGDTSEWNNIVLNKSIETVPKHGIGWMNSSVTRGTITGCRISSFSGSGILLQNTGTPTDHNLLISDCHIYNNNIGIYIRKDSEYTKITNCAITRNYYGILNRGGNNIISNCGIDSNIIGIQVDADEGKNGGHGSISNCSINHTNSNTGYGLIIRGTGRELVNNCNFYYSKTKLENTNGNIISNCGYGNAATIEIIRGTNSIICNCMMASAIDNTITLEDNDNAKIINCYSRSGAVVSPITI